jgi:hypothetical protein
MADVNSLVAGRTAQHKNFTFADRAQVSQDIKTAMAMAPGWHPLTASQKEALEMIAHKIARVIAGNPEHVDSWADIAGYAVLIQKELEGTPVDAPTPPAAPTVEAAPAVSPPPPRVAPVPPVVPPTVVIPPVVPSTPKN